MKRYIFILFLSGVCMAQAGGSPTIAPGTVTPNPFGFNTTLYASTWGTSMIKFHGDCYYFWRSSVAHVQNPAYVGVWKQAGCTGSYAAYAGASFDLGGGSCSSGPPGTLFCDNVNNNSIGGCSMGYDAHNDKLVCLTFSDNATGSASVGLSFSITSNGTTWSTPVQIPNHYWMGSSHGYMKGPTKFCFYASGNHPTASQGDQYEMCTTDDVTWTNDQLISSNMPSEGAVWYDATGTNGLVVIRNLPPTQIPPWIGTTTNGGATWTIVSSNITNVTPVCAISGGTLTQDSYPNPVLFAAAYPSGKVTLILTDRQTCTGSPGAMNNYLIATTFDPMVVIANPASLPPMQVIYTGVQTNGSVDCGYASMLESAGVNLQFGWACTYPAMSIKPILMQMAGHYVVTFSGAQIVAGAAVAANVQITGAAGPTPIYGGAGQLGATSTITPGPGSSVTLSTGDVLAQLQTTPEGVGQSWTITTNNQAVYLILFGGTHTFVDANTGLPFAFNAPVVVTVGGVTMYMYQSTNALYGSYKPKVAS